MPRMSDVLDYKYLLMPPSDRLVNQFTGVAPSKVPVVHLIGISYF